MRTAILMSLAFSLSSLAQDQTGALGLISEFLEYWNGEAKSGDPAPLTLDTQRACTSPAPPWEVKDFPELQNYLFCYGQQKPKGKNTYNKLRPIISDTVLEYNQIMQDDFPELDSNSLNSIFSCLLFRESDHWTEVNIGQFTEIGITGITRMLKKEPMTRATYDKKRKEFSKKPEDLAYIETIWNNSKRVLKMQALWRKFYPHKDPASVTKEALSNPQDPRMGIVYSMLMLMDCQLKYQQADIRFASDHQSFLACTAGYNMGAVPFMRHGLNARGKQFIDHWISNLRSSKHWQKCITARHVASVYRCSTAHQNYPNCGTTHELCSNPPYQLPKADDSPVNVQPRCVPQENC